MLRLRAGLDLFAWNLSATPVTQPSGETLEFLLTLQTTLFDDGYCYLDCLPKYRQSDASVVIFTCAREKGHVATHLFAAPSTILTWRSG